MNANTVVLQLNIQLPHTAGALAALHDLVRAATAVPGAALSAEPVVPKPVVPVPVVPVPRKASESPRLVLDPESRRVVLRDEPLDLTRLEFDLLLHLCARPGKVHRRSSLMAQVWGMGEPPGSRTIDVHIRRLRVKLGPDGHHITTVRGVGYRFDGADLVTIGPLLSAG
ncbi:winged helix-turn-helix domain-containing protein [Labedaea rhizosphaerae]|uniref:Transcriptional regulator n=1 Tax=Labedaea rhizosphaerae TaxID=598644 RepID=A0A4R6SFF3_LABRH|nr:winged helix-turn-helix domain-containing protein [Labedaea rhizosphaerae]TDQ00732.1 transcriptional regulator [Labedaea rhizosphaerae]